MFMCAKLLILNWCKLSCTPISFNDRFYLSKRGDCEYSQSILLFASEIFYYYSYSGKIRITEEFQKKFN